MRIYSNMHTHTSFCDGKESAETMVKAAIEKGFKSLGFSGHSYTPFDDDYCMSLEGTRRYRETVADLQKKYEGEIEILCGIEWDYYANINTQEWDYTIGSVHYVKSPRNGRYYDVDYTYDKLDLCIREGFAGDVGAMIKAYYDNVIDMACNCRPTVLGHFDLIRKLNMGNRFFNENSPKYLSIASNAIEQAVKAGAIVEVNTGGMFRGYCDTPYPDDWILKSLKKLGGSVIVSSDAHVRQSIDYAFDDIEDKLRKLGFKEVKELRKSGFISTKL
ncbi:MAG: histidinol-phosphatase [Eubacteriales bacterium]|nr:histidinol-phosphatase [Eubacteriales bacterium]MDD4389864.1 histidinol-phosphatase [Eubacteriales bacterium]